jgi:hypothetical protein
LPDLKFPPKLNISEFKRIIKEKKETKKSENPFFWPAGQPL